MIKFPWVHEEVTFLDEFDTRKKFIAINNTTNFNSSDKFKMKLHRNNHDDKR